MIYLSLAVYFLILSILIYGSLAMNPRMWLHRMPPAVREKVPGKTPEDRRDFLVPGVLLLLVMFFFPIASVLWLGVSDLRGIVGVLGLHFIGFTIWDTLVLDLLIFCRLTPKFVIIPGTQVGDYKDQAYHIRSGAKGMAISLVASGLFGLLLYALK